jgi:hypothetical protein
LFWAIRGGGGNFGIITSFDFYAQPCTAIVGGAIVYDMAEVERVLPAWPVRCAKRQRSSIRPSFSSPVSVPDNVFKMNQNIKPTANAHA